jgi:hypothetical protein
LWFLVFPSYWLTFILTTVEYDQQHAALVREEKAQTYFFPFLLCH